MLCEQGCGVNENGALAQSQKSFLDRVSTGSGSDLVSDLRAIFFDDS